MAKQYRNRIARNTGGAVGCAHDYALNSGRQATAADAQRHALLDSVPGQVQDEFDAHMGSAGRICFAIDHNSIKGCSNPECFKFYK